MKALTNKLNINNNITIFVFSFTKRTIAAPKGAIYCTNCFPIKT